MARRRGRRSGPPGDGGKRLLGVALALAALGALGGLGYVYATAPTPVALDRETLCPADGPRAVTVVLLDASDDLPDVAKREVRRRLTDEAEALPPGALFELRLLDPAAPGGRIAFSRCNPGDGAALSALTANPAMARRRWLEGFRGPLDAALDGGLRPLAARTSPIMETVQAVAVDRFAGRAAGARDKRLVIVSDMIEHGPDYSQYAGDLSYARFKATRAAKRTATDLRGASVQLLYVQRLGARPLDSGAHLRFWAEWVPDNGGQLVEAAKLQGAG